MPNWTPAQLDAYEIRNAPRVREPHPDDASPLESPLQEAIEAECNQRGWVCVRTRMDCATTFTTPGVPDFIVALHGGRTIWCECKSKTGKQTTDQRGFQMRVERLGHEYCIVRSLGEFMDLAKGTK